MIFNLASLTGEFQAMLSIKIQANFRHELNLILKTGK